MAPNNPKKDNPPVVDKSLETTRNIEYQLLNMKEELERLAEFEQPDIDLAPAVSHTFEILQQIDLQLKNMRSLLEHYSNLFKYKEGEKAWDLNRTLEREELQPPPFPPISPPTFPPTYRRAEPAYYYPPPYPKYNYVAPAPPAYECYSQPYYYGYPPYIPPQYEPYYCQPPQYPPYYSPSPEEQDNMYYDSAKYPTVASSEPAYSSKQRAIPRQSFKIAYYPWMQLTGRKGPTDSRVPYMNMYDLGGEYLVFVELPGVEKENLELRVDDQSIWINGKPTIVGSDEGTPVVQEHGYHEFFRQVYLPSKVVTNKTTCIFENGILKITLMKINPRKPPQKIKIR